MQKWKVCVCSPPSPPVPMQPSVVIRLHLFRDIRYGRAALMSVRLVLCRRRRVATLHAHLRVGRSIPIHRLLHARTLFAGSVESAVMQLLAD